METTQKTRIGFEIDKPTKQKIKQEAEKKGLTLSGYARMILKENLE